MTEYKAPIIEEHYDGSATYRWYDRNVAHQNEEDLPAEVEYDKDGNMTYECWFTNGEIHRVNNPAYIEYYPDGTVRQAEYWFYGVRVDGDPVVAKHFDDYKHPKDEELAAWLFANKPCDNEWQNLNGNGGYFSYA